MKLLPVAFTCVLLASAGLPPARAAVTASNTPAGPSANWTKGLPPEISTLLKRVFRTYRETEGYRDHGKVTLVQTSGRIKTTTEMPMELSFQRPNLLLLEGGQNTIASDGRTLQFAISGLQQFTTGAAPARLERRHLQTGTILGSVEDGHPELTDLLLREGAFETFTGQIAKFGGTTNVPTGLLLAYETTQGTKIGLTVDTNRMVLVRIDARYVAPSADAAAPNPVAPGSRAGTVRLSYELAPVELNPKFTAGHFAFTPPAGFKQVTNFDLEGTGGAENAPEEIPGDKKSTEPEGAHLLGKPAPPITGQDLAGQRLEAGDLKSKVVLLVFWSLSGGQYTLLSIPVVQEVADHFKGRADFLALGITADADQKQTALDLMQRKNATFRNLIDAERRLQRALNLGGEPTFLLLDRGGLVQWAKLGAPPTLKQELISEIEKLLAKRPE